MIRQNASIKIKNNVSKMKVDYIKKYNESPEARPFNNELNENNIFERKAKKTLYATIIEC
ncbi:hypothetical protein GcM1_238105 [Golovinomyces cichoracearum]|uniref:Uncharacterized protein n=1 Tax=Golovinomyces cichoracearum TaxID=62708 RepID=A0A420IJJ7_9PEZI|nr:hypothetical protein GcM1_238105 [Golovinomyces cichoracearum]